MSNVNGTGSGRGYRLGDSSNNANVLAQPPRSAVRNWHNTSNTNTTAARNTQPSAPPAPTQPQSQGNRLTNFFSRNQQPNNTNVSNGPSSAQLQQPINFNQRANINTLPPSNYDIEQQQYAQSQYNGSSQYASYDNGVPTGIGFMPSMNPDGTPPSCWQRCFPRSRWYALTTVLAVVLVIIFITELAVGAAKFGGAVVSGNTQGGPSNCLFLYMGADYTPYIRGNPPLDVWRLIVSAFLHAGFLHIIFNLYFLIIFGYVLEDRLYSQKLSKYWLSGTLWFSVFLFTAIMGNLFSSVLTPLTIAVGASGGLFGFLGFDLIYLIWNWPAIPGNKYEACLLVFVLIINLLVGIGSSGVDLYAHLGGLIAGVCMAIWVSPVIVKRVNSDRIMDAIRIFGAFLTLGLYLLMLLLLFSGNPCGSYGDAGLLYCTEPRNALFVTDGIDQETGCSIT